MSADSLRGKARPRRHWKRLCVLGGILVCTSTCCFWCYLFTPLQAKQRFVKKTWFFWVLFLQTVSKNIAIYRVSWRSFRRILIFCSVLLKMHSITFSFSKNRQAKNTGFSPSSTGKIFKQNAVLNEFFALFRPVINLGKNRLFPQFLTATRPDARYYGTVPKCALKWS